MSALGFVGGLAGAVAIGIYGLIAFVFLTAAMLELVERGRTGRLSFFLAFAGAMLWPVSLVIASAAAVHALRRKQQVGKPPADYAEPQRSGPDKPLISLVERVAGNSRAQGRAFPDQRPFVQPVRPVAATGTPPAANPPETSSYAVSGPALPLSSIGGPLVRTLAPLQMQPQPPFAMPGPDSRCRIILSPRQVLAAARQGESKPSASHHRLRQTGFSSPKKGKPD